MIRYAESMGMLERQPHPLGDIMRMTAERAVLATYYRNNILHLFAMPSLLACCFVSNARMRTVDIQRLVWRVYPYIRAELALRWPEEEIGAVADSLLEAFARSKLLQVNEDRSEWQRPAPTSLEAMQLSLLAEATIQTIERYYLVIALLLQAGSGNIGQEALEQRCHLMAQRMSLLYGLNSPGVLRQEPVPQFHRAAVPPRRDHGVGGRHAHVRRAAARRRRRRAAGAFRADQARHPAGDARAVRVQPGRAPDQSQPRPPRCAWCWRGASSIRCAAPWMRGSVGSSCGSWARSAPRGSARRAARAPRGDFAPGCARSRALMQDAAVIDQLLSREAAQPISRPAPAGWCCAAAGIAAARRSPPC